MVKKVLPKVEGMAESALSKTKIGSMVMGEVHSLLADADPSSFMLLKAKAECFVYSKGAPGKEAVAAFLLDKPEAGLGAAQLLLA